MSSKKGAAVPIYSPQDAAEVIRAIAKGEPEQQFIPGLEPEKNERVHMSAIRYALAEKARKEAISRAKEAH